MAPKPRELHGTLIANRYRVQECLGTGTMGSVYRAEHIHMKKQVAVKVLHAAHVRDPEVVERFQREAQAAANIDHPNICKAFDFGEFEDNSYYLVMEYLKGDTLIEAMKENPHFGERRAVHIALQMASALENAHSLGVVHRDLKPENILLIEKDSDSDFVKITDFGVAQVRMFKDAARLTQAGVVYGSPLYMSPEQAAGREVDHRADLYSVGVILYELLTGKLPFYAKTLPIVLNMHLTEQPKSFLEMAPERRIDPDLEALVMKLMAKKPDERFQSASELRQAIEAVQRKWEKLDHGSEIPWVRIIALAAMLAMIVGIGWLYLNRDTSAVIELADTEDTRVPPPEKNNKTGEDTEIGEGLIFDDVPLMLLSDKRREFMQREDVQALLTGWDEEEVEIEEKLQELSTLVEEEADNPHASFLLAQRLFQYQESERAYEALSEAIRRDDIYRSDGELLDLVLRRFESASAREVDLASTFLKKELGESADQRLAELAEHNPVLRTRRRALRQLRETGGFEKLPRWNQLTIELRHAVGCENNRVIINDIAEDGDPRALAALRRFNALPRSGCGESKMDDCWDCLREDLRKAIEVLEIQQTRRP